MARLCLGSLPQPFVFLLEARDDTQQLLAVSPFFLEFDPEFFRVHPRLPIGVVTLILVTCESLIVPPRLF